jgi:hypothetical protein
MANILSLSSGLFRSLPVSSGLFRSLPVSSGLFRSLPVSSGLFRCLTFVAFLLLGTRSGAAPIAIAANDSALFKESGKTWKVILEDNFLDKGLDLYKMVGRDCYCKCNKSCYVQIPDRSMIHCGRWNPVTCSCPPNPTVCDCPPAI